MEPSFVQNVSRSEVKPYGFEHLSFTNVSSQMMNPGQLPTYFKATQELGYMPFTAGDLPVPHEPIKELINEKNNVSNLPRKNTEKQFFEENLKDKFVRFRTASQRSWDVPIQLTDLRATDAIY